MSQPNTQLRDVLSSQLDALGAAGQTSIRDLAAHTLRVSPQEAQAQAAALTRAIGSALDAGSSLDIQTMGWNAVRRGLDDLSRIRVKQRLSSSDTPRSCFR